MQQTIKLHKEENFARFMVENQGSETIPIVFKVKTREQKDDGSEVNLDTTDITVFPPQMLLPGGQKKAIRVNYKGIQKLSKEQAYRVIAQQVPVNLKEDKESGIKMLLKFQNVLYVQDKDYQSNLVLTKFTSSKKGVEVEVRNSGEAHQYLHQVAITFRKGKKTLTPSKKELEELEGQNILAQSTRIFKFDKIKGLDESFVGQIKFENK